MALQGLSLSPPSVKVGRECVPVGVDDVNKVESAADLDDWDSEAEDGNDEDSVFEERDTQAPDDEVDVEEEEDDAVEQIDRQFLASLGGAVRVNSGSVNADGLRAMRWAPVTGVFEDDGVQAFPGLTSTPGGPVARLAEIYDNPAAPFFAFFPRSLWRMNRIDSSGRHARLVQLR